MAKRADNHDGSCTEVKSGVSKGRWRVQFTTKDAFGVKTRLSRLFKTKSEGKEFLRSLRRGEKVEAARNLRELTLSDWFDFLAENDWPESLDEKTIAAKKSRFGRYAKELIGHIPLSALDSLLIRDFYKRLRANGIGEPTLHSLKADLVRVYNLAKTPYGRVPMSSANPFCLTLKSVKPRDAVAATPLQICTALAEPTLDQFGLPPEE